MSKYKIKDEIDYLLAQSQTETDIAKEIVGKIREKNNSTQLVDSDGYYEEKLALKMLDFFKEEERVISLYAEAKRNYPLLVELMENKRPYLKELLEEAKKLNELRIMN